MCSAIDKVSFPGVSKVQLLVPERDSKPNQQKESPLKSTSGFSYGSQISSALEVGRDKSQKEEMESERAGGKESARPPLPLSSSSSCSKESGIHEVEEGVLAVKIGEQERKEEAIVGIRDGSIGGRGGGGGDDDDDGYHTPKSPRHRIPEPIKCPPAPKKPPPVPTAMTTTTYGRVRRRFEFDIGVGLVLHAELDDVSPSKKKARGEAAIVE